MRRPGMRVVRALGVVAATIAFAAMLLIAWRALGGASVGFAVAVVWLPMTWLGTVSHVVPFRLPATVHALRGWERDGRVYERLGVGLIKRLLRRRPIAWFNPGLRLPAERSAAGLATLARRMSTAEASHGIALVLSLGAVAHAAARGWWLAAAVTLGLDVLINGYPVMLQRYNRALLRARFGAGA